MGDHISVDPTALHETATAIQDTLAIVPADGLKSLDLSSEQMGHGGLADRFGEFRNRWTTGLGHLRDDGTQIAERLSDAANYFAASEEDRAAANQRAADAANPLGVGP